MTSSDEAPSPAELSPQQLAAWNALLPILAEHGLLAVKGGGPDLPTDDKPMTKEEAAEYLGFSVSKLNRCIKKKQISYEKYGAGRTATVRFQRAKLEEFKKEQKCPRARGPPQALICWIAAGEVNSERLIKKPEQKYFCPGFDAFPVSPFEAV